MSSPTSAPCRAVIVTALPVEFNAVCEHLTDRREETHPQGTVYEKGHFRPDGDGEWEVIVAEIGAGNVGAAAEAERVICHYAPNVVLFVGVAGGVKDVAVGDVVASSKVYAYESGKESDGFKPRPMVHESNYRLVQRAKAEARSGKWRQRIIDGLPGATPRALVGPIAAGEKVVADTKSPTALLISSNYGDTLAVEMESYGFLHGAYLHQHLAALVVRGISDLLDGKANADRSGSQERASKNASAFCFEVLAKLGACPGGGGRSTEPDADDSMNVTSMQKTISAYESRFQVIEKAIGIRAVTEIAAGATIDSHYLTEMNSARDLLNSGHGTAARVFLDRLQTAAGKEPFDIDFRFRLHTNLGASALLLGEYEVAERYFESALQLKPEDPKALANRAQIALARDQYDVALAHAFKAWSVRALDPHVASIYLRALDGAGRSDEARQIADEQDWMRSDAQCALVLALIEFHAARYVEAESLAQASLLADPENAQVMELLARCIVVPLQIDLEQNPPLPGKLPPTVISRANEAKGFFDRAVSILENQDHKELLLAAVANRGMVLSLLGRYADALRDYDRVLSQNPDQQLVKVNKARLLLGAGQPHEALRLLESVDAESRTAAWNPVATAYLATGQPKKALQVLTPRWEVVVDRRNRIRVAELLLEAYSALSDGVGAAKVATTLESDFPTDPEAIATAAEWRASQPDGYEHALALFFGALDSVIDSRQKDRITLSLAELYYRNRHFAESADLYGKLIPYFDHPGLFRRYLLSLFYSGAYREALNVAADKRAGGRALPFVSVIEAHLLEKIGDLASAERLLVELVEIEPDDPDHRISLAYLRYRRGDYDGSKQAVLGIGVEEVKGNAHQLLALAKVRAWLELDGVLELAYRARRIGFDNPEIHQAYVSLVLNREREQDPSLTVKQVRAGTTIHLSADDGREQVFTIVEGLDADLHRGELLPSDPLAMKLLGRSIGESVTLKETELEIVVLRIARIESQYVHAFQETLLNFSTWFPAQTEGPDKLTVDDAGIDKVLHLVSRRSAHVESVLDLYRANRITLGMLAQLVGRSLVEVWFGLQSGGETRIIASKGQDESASTEVAELASTQELVLDLVAVLTFASLGLLPVLKNRFKLVLTTQFVFDEISDELTLERAGLRASGTIYLHGDRFVMESALEVTTGERRILLESIMEFLRTEACLQPTPALLDLPLGQNEPPMKSAFASILLARERGALFCSDDLVLRTRAKGAFGVSCVWSQTVLLELATSGHLSESQYHCATMALVQKNYTFVRVSERDYMWLLREEGMRITPRFVNALRVLEGPDCTEDSAVVVAGAFLRDICLEPELRKTRHLLIDACISALKHGRQSAIVLYKLDANAQRCMLMNPDGLAEVRQAIALWGREADYLDEKVRIRRSSSGGKSRSLGRGRMEFLPGRIS